MEVSLGSSTGSTKREVCYLVWMLFSCKTVSLVSLSSPFSPACPPFLSPNVNVVALTTRALSPRFHILYLALTFSLVFSIIWGFFLNCDFFCLMFVFPLWQHILFLTDNKMLAALEHLPDVLISIIVCLCDMVRAWKPKYCNVWSSTVRAKFCACYFLGECSIFLFRFKIIGLGLKLGLQLVL